MLEHRCSHDVEDDRVDEASRQSFPASDPPAWWAGTLPGSTGRPRASTTVPYGPLRVRRLRRQQVTTLTPIGELDVATQGTLARAVGNALADDIAVLILDLREVTFVDAAGLQSVTAAMNQCFGEGVRCQVWPGQPLLRLVGMVGGSLEGRAGAALRRAACRQLRDPPTRAPRIERRPDDQRDLR